jgi:hypothetical protein
MFILEKSREEDLEHLAVDAAVLPVSMLAWELWIPAFAGMTQRPPAAALVSKCPAFRDCPFQAEFLS